jgi:hypothetical protein
MFDTEWEMCRLSLGPDRTHTVEKGDRNMMYANTCADVLLHIELSVRPPIWVGPDWIRLFVFLIIIVLIVLQWSLHLCFVCLAVRPSAHLGWTGPVQTC